MLTKNSSIGLLRRMREERGGVLAWFAIWLPALILFAALAVDVANWFEHKRHLQLQADAAALAGAGKFRLPFSLCDDNAVKNEARNYAGQHLDGGESLWASLYNHQVGGTPAERVHALINFKPDDPNDPNDPVVFWRSDSDDDGGSPCAAKFIEVKMTETDLPWFFGLPPSVVDWIDARARVSLMQLGTATGLLPIGVPETDPTAIAAIFVNECTGATIATSDMTKQVALDNGLVVWMNNGTGLAGDPGPLSVSMPTTCTKVGVRIAVASRGTSTDCSDQFVDCYELSTSNGIGFVRSYPTSAGTATAPRLRNVELVPASSGCADPYFFSDKKPCGSFGVRATVDFGGAPPPGAQVDASFDDKNNWVNMPPNSITGDWETPTNAFSPSGNAGPLEGPRSIRIRWKSSATCKGGGGCILEGGLVHRTYGSADNLSGPIKMLQVFESGVQIGSAPAGTSPQLVVRIAIPSNLKIAQDVNDPPVALKIVGNQTQALNCDVDFTNLSDELAYGCGQRVPPASPTSPFAEAYTPNLGQLNCRATNKVELWAMTSGTSSDPEWPCVALKTGHATNQVPAGLNTRVLGTDKPLVCTSPNNWSNYGTTAWDDNDRRIVHVFITPFGSFQATGNDETVPVVGFATFYVTGWTGQGGGFNNPCEGLGDDPVPNNDPGTIVGHFIRYIANVNSGTNGQPCDENSLTPCVAVMTE